MKHYKYLGTPIIFVAGLVLAGAFAFKYLHNKFTQEKDTVVIQGRPGSQPQAPVSTSTQQIKTTISASSKAQIQSKIQSRATGNHTNCLSQQSNCSSTSQCCGHLQCLSGICQ